MSIEILPVYRANALGVTKFTEQDLRDAHLPEDEVLRRADMWNRDHVEAQRQRLSTNPEQYRGAYDDGTLVGVIKIDEWFTQDQRPYELSRLKRFHLRRHDLQHSHRLPTHPLGIFALIVAGEVSDKELVAKKLLDASPAGEDENRFEIRIGMRDEDPLKPLLINEYGFQPTDKIGKISGITQRLHIRPLKTVEQT